MTAHGISSSSSAIGAMSISCSGRFTSVAANYRNVDIDSKAAEATPTTDSKRASVSLAALIPRMRAIMLRPRLSCLLNSSKSHRLYSKMVDALESLPEVEKLSDRVIRVLGGNPSKVSAVVARARDTF